MLRSIAFSLNLYLSLAAFAIAQFSNGATTAAPAKVPNFHQVADKLYRSGQPDIEGFRALADRYGIRTIISLRSVARNDLLLAGSDLRLRLRRFPLHAFVVAHEQDKIVAALRAIRAGVRNGPTLVHCEHGSERTGLIVALYRILYQGWSKKQALHEMRAKAFGFHTIWGNIPRFIEDVDIGSLKQRVEGTNR